MFVNIVVIETNMALHQISIAVRNNTTDISFTKYSNQDENIIFVEIQEQIFIHFWINPTQIGLFATARLLECEEYLLDLQDNCKATAPKLQTRVGFP